MIGKARAYLAAEASLLIEGKVAPEIHEARVTVCRHCPSLVPDPADPVGFCGACGCGTRTRARLHESKAWMPRATCPLGKWPHAPRHGDAR